MAGSNDKCSAVAKRIQRRTFPAMGKQSARGVSSADTNLAVAEWSYEASAVAGAWEKTTSAADQPSVVAEAVETAEVSALPLTSSFKTDWDYRRVETASWPSRFPEWSKQVKHVMHTTGGFRRSLAGLHEATASLGSPLGRFVASQVTLPPSGSTPSESTRSNDLFPMDMKVAKEFLVQESVPFDCQQVVVNIVVACNFLVSAGWSSDPIPCIVNATLSSGQHGGTSALRGGRCAFLERRSTRTAFQ